MKFPYFDMYQVQLPQQNSFAISFVSEQRDTVCFLGIFEYDSQYSIRRLSSFSLLLRFSVVSQQILEYFLLKQKQFDSIQQMEYNRRFKSSCYDERRLCMIQLYCLFQSYHHHEVRLAKTESDNHISYFYYYYYYLSQIKIIFD